MYDRTKKKIELEQKSSELQTQTNQVAELQKKWDMEVSTKQQPVEELELIR